MRRISEDSLFTFSVAEIRGLGKGGGGGMWKERGKRRGLVDGDLRSFCFSCRRASAR